MTEKQFDFIKTMCCDIEEIFPTLPADTILFIACQSALESNYGTSTLCKVNKNYFGMRNPMTRPSTSTQRSNKAYIWAVYESRHYSIVDYFLCLSYRKPKEMVFENLDFFEIFISSFYCPEKDYIDKITKIFNQFKSLQNEKDW